MFEQDGGALKRQRTEDGWQSAGFPPGGEDPEKAELVKQIKDMQRSNESMKQTWWAYCRSKGTGNFDPNRHDSSFLQQFIQDVNSGSITVSQAPDVKRGGSQGSGDDEGSGKEELVMRVKALQRGNDFLKNAWWSFCRAHGSSNYDPSRHEAKFLGMFIQEMAKMGLTPEAVSGKGKGKGDGGAAGYKTVMCKFYETGGCRKGDECHFAHGPHELQSDGGSSSGWDASSSWGGSGAMMGWDGWGGKGKGMDMMGKGKGMDMMGGKGGMWVWRPSPSAEMAGGNGGMMGGMMGKGQNMMMGGMMGKGQEMMMGGMMGKGQNMMMGTF